MIPKYLILPVLRGREGSCAAESLLPPDSGSAIDLFQLIVW